MPVILNSVGELFDEEPQQWGLRGDPSFVA